MPQVFALRSCKQKQPPQCGLLSEAISLVGKSPGISWLNLVVRLYEIYYLTARELAPTPTKRTSSQEISTYLSTLGFAIPDKQWVFIQAILELCRESLPDDTQFIRVAESTFYAMAPETQARVSAAKEAAPLTIKTTKLTTLLKQLALTEYFVINAIIKRVAEMQIRHERVAINSRNLTAQSHSSDALLDEEFNETVQDALLNVFNLNKKPLPQKTRTLLQALFQQGCTHKVLSDLLEVMHKSPELQVNFTPLLYLFKQPRKDFIARVQLTLAKIETQIGDIENSVNTKYKNKIKSQDQASFTQEISIQTCHLKESINKVHAHIEKISSYEDCSLILYLEFFHFANAVVEEIQNLKTATIALLNYIRCKLDLNQPNKVTRIFNYWNNDFNHQQESLEQSHLCDFDFYQCTATAHERRRVEKIFQNLSF